MRYHQTSRRTFATSQARELNVQLGLSSHLPRPVLSGASLSFLPNTIANAFTEYSILHMLLVMCSRKEGQVPELDLAKP